MDLLKHTVYQALRVSEIHSDYTDFDLFMEKGGEIIPYAIGRHRWTPEEKSELLSRQFVLFFQSAKSEEVVEYLAQNTGPQAISLGSEQYFIADGIGEFLKTRMLYPVGTEQLALFKGMALALSRYLTNQNRLSRLLENLARHDAFSFYHSMRTAAYALALASYAGKPVRTWELMLGSILHDVGNLMLDPALLNRAGSLKDDEWKSVRRHPEDGHQLIASVGLPDLVNTLVLNHHERMDGQGYPHRLRLASMPRELRILNFAEVFAALTMPRPYQKARKADEALAFMETSLATYIDSDLFGSLKTLLGGDQVKQNQKAS